MATLRSLLSTMKVEEPTTTKLKWLGGRSRTSGARPAPRAAFALDEKVTRPKFLTGLRIWPGSWIAPFQLARGGRLDWVELFPGVICGEHLEGRQQTVRYLRSWLVELMVISISVFVYLGRRLVSRSWNTSYELM